MIEVKNLKKEFKHKSAMINALNNANLKVEKGEFVAIVGPSGSGKSTFLLTIGGLVHPTQGSVLIKNKSIYEMGITERTLVRLNTIGFIFQTFNLIPYLTAMENVQIPLLLAGKSHNEQQDRAKELLARFDLSDRIEHVPSELSIGQQQRVALARALANNPDILLADEPTGNLDPKLTEEMVEYFKLLNSQGSTIVMVTHNPMVAKSAKRQISIIAGEIK